jgi:methionyl-tRNA formyltransferase
MLKLKIVFIGCVKSSEIFLRTLIEHKFNIVGVVTKEKSSFNSDFCNLSDLCDKKSVDYIYANNINDAEIVEYIADKQPDIIYCFGWSQLIKKDILRIPLKGIVGFHPAELPFNRGRHPVIWALFLGLKKTASTFFLMNEGADTGDIISQELIDISYEDTANSLYDKISNVAKHQIIKFTNEFQNNELNVKKQDVSLGNLWRKRNVNDGKIDWRMSSLAIYNLVRSLTKPYVGAHFMFDEKEVKVWTVKEIITDQYKNIEPGKVVKYVSPNNFYVKTFDNLINVIDCENVDLKEGAYLY